jgi:hypothetical protein
MEPSISLGSILVFQRLICQFLLSKVLLFPWIEWLPGMAFSARITTDDK